MKSNIFDKNGVEVCIGDTIAIQLQKTHPANRTKRLTVCNYGYFLPRGKWEAIVINLRPIKRTLWIWRKSEYKKNWPVRCA